MLAYIDESGYPTPGDLSPWNTLVAVCTPESASRDMSRWLHAAVRASFPATDPQVYEVKAATLLNRRQYEHSAERRRLVADVTSLMERLPLSVFGVRARRPVSPPAWPRTRVDPPHRLLIERIELHMRRAHEPDAFAKLIFDETNGGSDAARSRALRTFMHRTDEGRSWTHVLDVPLFVSSHITPGIQMADLMAGALRHYQVLRNTGSTGHSEWEQAITRLEPLASARTQDFYVGGETYYGLYTMPDRYYDHPPGPRAF